MSSSGEKKKKLVISADDLQGSGQSQEDADQAAPTAELKTDVTQAIVVKQKPASPKAAPPTKAAGAGVATPTPTAAAGAEPWYRKHRRVLIFGGGLFAVLVLAFIVSFALLGLFDTEDDTAREALTSSTTAFERSTAEARQAAQAPLPFTALSEVATASEGRGTTIGETIDDLAEKVDEERLVRPSVKALKAEREFLVRFSRISEFPESELERRWNRLKPELTASQQSIDSSRQAVLALNLGDTAHLLPANTRITTALSSASKIILESNRKVQAWRSERDAAEAQLASAESYKNEMSSLMSEYYQQRNVTQDLVHEQHVLWTVAEEQLLSQASERQGIIEGMESLTVPSGAESSHDQMVSLATQSKALLEEAATAAREEPDIIWTGSPGWQRLSTESEAITQQFASAESAVLAAAEQAVASEQAKVSQVGPKPQL